MSEVARWTLADGLTAYRETLRDAARDRWHHETLVWAALAPHQRKPDQPPAPPALLR